MKPLVSLSFAAFAALAVALAGCAAAPSAGDTTCRRINAPDDEENPLYCGNAREWAEFDRRAAMINAGVTCRKEPVVGELCMTADQWKKYRLRASDMAQAHGSAP
jgi:hypothetical protein